MGVSPDDTPSDVLTNIFKSCILYIQDSLNNIDIKKFAETTIELPGFAVTMSSIEEAIKKDIKDKGIEGKEISVYVNVEQKAAYYTVDGQGSDDYRIDLNTL